MRPSKFGLPLMLLMFAGTALWFPAASLETSIKSPPADADLLFDELSKSKFGDLLRKGD
jgi:hypothetical protein